MDVCALVSAIFSKIGLPMSEIRR